MSWNCLKSFLSLYLANNKDVTGTMPKNRMKLKSTFVSSLTSDGKKCIDLKISTFV